MTWMVENEKSVLCIYSIYAQSSFSFSTLKFGVMFLYLFLLQGGYRIRLLDANEEVLHSFTNGFVGRDNPT